MMMPVFENTNDNCISSSQGSEEFDVYPPPKRFCSGLSDYEHEINCNQNHHGSSSTPWESWDCNEVAKQLNQAGLGDVVEMFKSEFHSGKFVCFVGFRLYVPVNNFSVMSKYIPGLNQYEAMKMKCLVQGHNTVTAPLMRFEPATL